MPAKKKRVNSRNKGANFERWVTNALKDAGIDAKRGGTAQASVNIVMPDVIVPGWWPELKVGSRNYVNPVAALKQAEADRASSSDISFPVAITRVDRDRQVWCHMRLGDLANRACRNNYVDPAISPWMVITIRFEDWVEIVKAGM